MKRFFAIIISVYLFFLIEFLLFDIFGRWGKPDLLLLLIIFYNLYLGIRHGLVCAFFAGFLKDVFSPDVVGTHILLFMMCACLAILLRRNFYQPGSRLSRLMVTLGVVVSYVLAWTVLQSISSDVQWLEIFRHVFLPEVLTTMVVATFVFIKLKNMAVRIQL